MNFAVDTPDRRSAYIRMSTKDRDKFAMIGDEDRQLEDLECRFLKPTNLSGLTTFAT